MSASTTTQPEVITSFVSAYQSGDRKVQGRIRSYVTAKAMSYTMAGNFQMGARFAATASALTVTKSTPAPVDPVAAAVTAVAVLESAIGATLAGLTPDQLAAFNRGSVRVSASDDRVARVVGLVTRTRSARRDIQGVYDRAFADAEIGTELTVRQIAVAGALPDYSPSDGAISARLTDPKGCTLTGVEPCTVNGVKGARKVA